MSLDMNPKTDASRLRSGGRTRMPPPRRSTRSPFFTRRCFTQRGAPSRIIHLLVEGLRPPAVDAQEGVEVRGGVELVGQDAVRLRGLEMRFALGGHGPPVAEPLQDHVEGLRILGPDRDLGRGRQVVGLAHLEVEHLELPAPFHDAVEHAAQDVRVDEVPFKPDRFLDHRLPP
jgi:hypothetical protein